MNCPLSLSITCIIFKMYNIDRIVKLIQKRVWPMSVCAGVCKIDKATVLKEGKIYIYLQISND